MIFHKMHGIGNDYLYVDCIGESANVARLNDRALAGLARKMSDRHFGAGADGLILILPSKTADCRMRMFNSDGSEAEMCGNGVRCVAKYAYEKGIARKSEITVETGAGVLALKVFPQDGVVKKVRVNMGLPRLAAALVPVKLGGPPARPKRFPPKFTVPTDAVIARPLKVLDRKFDVTCVSMGNPHCVIFVEDAENFAVEKYGPAIETHAAFPKKTNVEFVTVLAAGEVRQRTWERGAGETLACGTGASAVCVAGALNRLTDRKILAHLKGGDLELDWADDGSVYMTGPAEYVFRGDWPL